MVNPQRPGVPVPLITTSVESTRVEDGTLFSSGVRAVDLLADGEYDILFKVPAGIFPHIFTLDLKSSDGDIDVALYESPTLTSDGVLLHPPSNRNRASSNEPSMIIWEEPVVTDEGLTLLRDWLPASSVGQGVKGDKLEYGDEKWIWNESTNYLYRITNNGGAAVNFVFRIVWSEDTEV